MLREVSFWRVLPLQPGKGACMEMRRVVPSDPGAVFAARGWLSEHPAAFRAMLLKDGVPIDMRIGSCVFRRDDESSGLFGILSGAIAIEGGTPAAVTADDACPATGRMVRDQGGVPWRAARVDLSGA
jgi:hypothetical protein